ncbi:ADP-ribosyl cyclase/cyclic ADP-ribose hydrolase 1 [Chanos chanos]|uniref:ADP-ribosyl cyclase/cyclic ADP-ribose hydrolase n=1 Tax=Chanos chanos TaxID=29144 RepID=A0A6J2UWG8_CHACN|nr:ADP-ribosyl cyclase/cyclic ADP-ribose hydrolase 1-like [Chanos chanos]
MSDDQYESVSGNTRRNRCLYIVLGVVLICVLVVGVSLGLALSPKGVKSEILQRCETYKKLHPEVSSGNDCQKIWTAFEQAYVGRNSCDVPVENYDTLIRAVKQEIQCNKTLFWSKSKDLAHAFTEKRKCKMTLEDTLLGYMLDDLTWCSKPDSKETFSSNCPGWTDCEKNPVRSFWVRASANLAASTCGHASVLLSASVNPPYNQNSIFSSVEVQNLNHSILDSMAAYLVTDVTDKTNCNDASLVTLKNDLPPNVEFSCKEMPLSDFQMCLSDLDKPCLGCH